MKNNFNKILTGFSFFIPLVLYIITMAPTTSFWDCGEFISTSYILGVPHPPGSPLYLLLGNVFSSIPFFKDIGARVNLISPIVSALSVMFLYQIIVFLLDEFKNCKDSFIDENIIHFSAFTAAITFAVTDSHWFNAVEAEVYSFSTFFTSIVVWMILRWSKSNNDDWNVRYLLIIIYMFGLAIGVHLLNLLTLPFVALIIYFKKFNFSIKSFLLTMLFTVITFLTIYIGFIKGLPDITNKFGSIYFIIIFPLIIISTIILIQISSKNKTFSFYAYYLSIASSSIIFLLIISSSFIKNGDQISMYKQNQIIEIQEKIDQYDKEIYKQQELMYQNNIPQDNINEKITKRNMLVDDFRILYENYFNFEEIKNDLSFIQLINSQPKINLFYIFILLLSFVFIIYRYTRVGDETTNSIFKFLFTSVLLILIGYSTYATVFIRATQGPAINENSPDNIDRALAYMNRDQYGDWEILDWSSTLKRPENTNWKRYAQTKMDPSFSEQINFFLNYQINEMYLRYFAWQFIGKGDKEEFPWYIQDLNGKLIGNQRLDGINWFRYGLPLAFIFGILGIFFHFRNDWRRALSVLSLFLATGLMIIIYLNQYDPQPRERDYSYVGSFFAFSIWIGIGLSCFLTRIKKFFDNSNIATFISVPLMVIIFMAMPVKMLATDYFEHNRKGNFVAWDYGYNLLNSCEPHGIIFTNGDNDTFPLWYLQEVEGLRKDVNVVNLSLLNTPWYINQLITQNPKLDLDFKSNIFKDDIYQIEPYSATEAAFEICESEYSDEPWNILNCNLSIGKESLDFNISPKLVRKLLRVQDYLILEIIKDIGKTRPIYFAATVSENNQLGLKNYLSMEGMAYRLNYGSDRNNINYDKMKQNLMGHKTNELVYTIDDYNNRFKTDNGVYRYTNLNDTSIYYSDNIQRLVQNYRIGFIRLAQEELKSNRKNKNNNAEEIINLMDKYFPKERLPVEPGVSLLISDSIYANTGNQVKQKEIINNLFKDNLPIETKIFLLHKFSEFSSNDDIISAAENLITIHEKQLDFELQKYLGDILSDNLGKENFITFGDSILSIYPFKGLLYSLVRTYEEVGLRDEALAKVKNWLKKDPNDEDIKLLYEYLLEMNSYQ